MPTPADGPALPVPATEAGRAGLAALLRTPPEALVAVDYDGTLSPIVSDPAAAVPHPGAIAALRDVSARAGTVAVITGRPALAAVEIGGLAAVPGLIVLGSYGRERWESGTLTAPPVPPGVAAAREELPGVLAEAGAPDGTWTEDKSEALAVHTRRTAEPGQALERLRGPLTALAERTGLAVEPGRMVIELRPPGADKGQTLEDLVSERPVSAVMYCGDDLGDGPAFQAVARLREDGIPGLAVCSGSAEVTALVELADLVVDGPDGVVRLLAALAAAMAPPT
ncbi:MAG TPA: trehalose-phosphatase [Streptosporangiaceae bacterium]|nr:trehalose-phosphatase [Streptosporangiaceae bacterium]